MQYRDAHIATHLRIRELYPIAARRHPGTWRPTCHATCWPAPSAKQSLNLLAGFAFHPAGKCDHANGAGGGRFCLSQKPHVRNDLG
jgi:hypothetical protein